MADIISYLRAGERVYTVPVGVSYLDVHMWGAGGSSGNDGEIVQVQTGEETYISGYQQVQVGTNTTTTSTTQYVQVTQPAAQENFSQNLGSQYPFGGCAGAGWTDLIITVNNFNGITLSVSGASADYNRKGPGASSGTIVTSDQLFSLNASSVWWSSYAYGRDNMAFRVTTNYSSSSKTININVYGNCKGGTNSDYTRLITSLSVVMNPPVPTTTTVAQTVPVSSSTPVYETQPIYSTKPVYTNISGGRGGPGGGGAYVYKRIEVQPGDVVKFVVGSRGFPGLGGGSLTSPAEYHGGNSSFLGGGGGGASVVTVNDVVVAVAGAGAGGGAGGPNGKVGEPGTAGGRADKIVNDPEHRGQSSNNRGGGGGGGWYGGAAGYSGDLTTTGGTGGEGGGSLGDIIISGNGIFPGGTNTEYYSLIGRCGYHEQDGAIVIDIGMLMSVGIKKNGVWKTSNNSFVKVNGSWKKIYQGYVKHNGIWKLIGLKSNVILPASSLISNVSSIYEGNTVSFTLTTTGIANNTPVPYTVSGIASTDLLQGSLTGNFVVGVTDTIYFTPKLNYTTNGIRNLSVRINGTATVANCAIIDTSTTPTYNITANTTSVNEGQAVRFTVTSVNPRIGDKINWTMSGISASDVVSGTNFTGNFVWGTNQYVDVALTEDLSRLEGPETITMTIGGQATGVSNVKVTVNDTSFKANAAPGGQCYTTPGTYTFAIPLYANRLEIMAVGGGGGGGDPYPLASGGAGGASEVYLNGSTTAVLVRATGGSAGLAGVDGQVGGSVGGAGVRGNALVTGFGTGTNAPGAGPVPGARSILKDTNGEVKQSTVGIIMSANVGAGGQSGSTHNSGKWYVASAGGSGGGAFAGFGPNQLFGNLTITVGNGGYAGSGGEALAGQHGAVCLKWY